MSDENTPKPGEIETAKTEPAQEPEIGSHSAGELSESDLEKVAGGVFSDKNRNPRSPFDQP